MGFLRALVHFFLGLLLALVNISFFSTLRFPFSQFPIIAILISLALINRTRPTFFWLIFTAVAVGDLYRSGMFGIGIITFVLIVVVGVRISSDVVTHRSLLGCAVISAMVGFMWAAGTMLLTLFIGWFRHDPAVSGTLAIFVSAIVQSGVCAGVCALIYLLTPRWLHNRSPIIIGTRSL